MNTHKFHGYNDALISYLKEQSNLSYHEFLIQYRDIVINSVSSNDWKSLDKSWSDRFLTKARDQLKRTTFNILKKRVKSERLKNELHTYWKDLIEEKNMKRKSDEIMASAIQELAIASLALKYNPEAAPYKLDHVVKKLAIKKVVGEHSSIEVYNENLIRIYNNKGGMKAVTKNFEKKFSSYLKI
ncbi:hypothetical protein RclHR1_11120002 [Rhizophagus clarus]|uniref:Uncharacterized protein n=1 Tax=Rhizophagus clarus TaxID=94130 RepID=A0A2Z6QV58_9GLOM|nr:hypothetical protein RclHR1_11120002 [Rhizophagus clarus]GES87596.1 hypothetical protein GLOIN_2v1867465 [Rhizophagus clarus]